MPPAAGVQEVLRLELAAGGCVPDLAVGCWGGEYCSVW